jgi:hypothetical protein
MSELQPLDDDILALVKGAKHVAEIDPARRASILAVTAAKIGAGVGGGGDGGGAGASASASAGASAGAGALGKLGVAIALFVAGVGVGVMIDRALIADGGREPSGPVAIAARPVAATTSSSAPPLEAVSAASLPDAPRASNSGATTASASARGAGSGEAPSSRGLAAERALLDVARSALARGEAGEALAATERHAREYPDGSLLEEREAIAVKALVALGRMDEARTRARALELRFPNGLTVRAVKAAVGEAP